MAAKGKWNDNKIKDLHLKKLKIIKSQSSKRIDNSPPATMEVAKNRVASYHFSRNKEFNDIFKKNQVILSALDNIKTRKKKQADQLKIHSYSQGRKSLNYNLRKKEFEKIIYENQFILSKLSTQGATLSKKELDIDYKKSLQYRNNLVKPSFIEVTTKFQKRKTLPKLPIYKTTAEKVLSTAIKNTYSEKKLTDISKSEHYDSEFDEMLAKQSQLKAKIEARKLEGGIPQQIQTERLLAIGKTTKKNDALKLLENFKGKKEKSLNPITKEKKGYTKADSNNSPKSIKFYQASPKNSVKGEIHKAQPKEQQNFNLEKSKPIKNKKPINNREPEIQYGVSADKEYSDDSFGSEVKDDISEKEEKQVRRFSESSNSKSSKKKYSVSDEEKDSDSSNKDLASNEEKFSDSSKKKLVPKENCSIKSQSSKYKLDYNSNPKDSSQSSPTSNDSKYERVQSSNS